jgi:predicted nucleotidyltransferase
MFPKMGRIVSPTTGLANVLFSKVQQRVLALIFAHPDRSFYTSEIIKTVDSGTGAVERELSRLQSSGLVSVERIGNQKHYRANRHSPIFEELHGLVLKTVALKVSLKTALEPYAETIKSAFIYGSVAKGTDTARSDIDLMVIGDRLDYSGLYTALQNTEDRVRRKINPMFLSATEWRRRSSEDGSFARKLRSQPKLFVIGSGKHLST